MADGDQWARIIWVVVVLVMVASALVARRVPGKRLLVWGAAWVAILAAIYLAFDVLGLRLP
ncbi:MAG: hypothetical protein ABW184_10245 [Sphingobium sp.]